MISRFICMCTGYSSRSQTPSDQPNPDAAKSPSKGHPEKTLLKNPVLKHPSAKKQSREVHVDKTTAIPLDLYWDLMRAGERIKNSGQHQLKGHRSGKPHLVNLGVN
uniref:Uncharacterized protein n=1 Tax=Zooxanthella nutricula TaxID=1333877 RepID=A0A7S2N5I7_9DINO